MLDRLKQLLAPPVYEDEVTDGRARLINVILLSLVVLLTFQYLAHLLTGDYQLISEESFILAGAIVIFTGIYIATRLRYIQFAIYTLVSAGWLTIVTP